MRVEAALRANIEASMRDSDVIAPGRVSGESEVVEEVEVVGRETPKSKLRSMGAFVARRVLSSGTVM